MVDIKYSADPRQTLKHWVNRNPHKILISICFPTVHHLTPWPRPATGQSLTLIENINCTDHNQVRPHECAALQCIVSAAQVFEGQIYNGWQIESTHLTKPILRTIALEWQQHGPWFE